MSDTETNNDMSIATTSITVLLFKNSVYVLCLAFYLLVDFMISIFPDWRNFLENFKLIGGAIIIVLVVIKLVLEIKKLKKDK